MTLGFPFRIASLLFVALICAPSLRAQHTFTISIPGIEAAITRPIVQTPDGGFVLLFRKMTYEGETASFDVDSTFNGLAKFTADGLVEWSRYFRIGFRHARPVSLLQGSDGGFIVMGDAYDVADDEQDITVLRCNAHGHLLSAKIYDIDGIDEVTDGILMENGNVMLAGSVTGEVAEDEPTMVEIVTLVVDPNGEVLMGNRYSNLIDYRYAEVALRNLQDGNTALIGSIHDSSSYNSPGLVCVMSPDGIMQDAFVINPPTYFDKSTITDIVPSRDGEYTVLGNIAMYDCSGPYFDGFAFSCNRAGDTFWSRIFANDQSLSLDRFMPANGPDGFAVVGQTGPHFDPTYVLTNLNAAGRIRDAQSVVPFSSDYAQSEPYSYSYSPFPSFRSNYLPIADGGVVIAGTRTSEVFDNDEWVGVRKEALITRLSPDLASCEGRPESVRSNDNGLKFFSESDFDEEPATGDADSDVPETSDQITGDGTEWADTFFTTATDSDTSESANPESPGNSSKPFVQRIDPGPVRFEIAADNVIDHRTADHPLEPLVFCQENPFATASGIDHSALDERSESPLLHLSPNSVAAGTRSEADFTLAARSVPEITLLTIATGKVIRTVDPGAIDWSPSSGHGAATIETSGLAVGMYLVRVRAGERQLTAKLEIR